MAKLVCVAAMAALVVGAAADERLGIGVEAGIYVPSDARIRDVYGSTWFSFGFRPMRLDQYRKPKLDGNIGIVTRSAGGNKLAIVNLSGGYSRPLGDPNGSTVPFVAVRVGPSYVDYALTDNGTRRSGKKIVLGGNVEVGALMNERIRFSVRYDLLSQVDGLNFNGLSVGLAYVVGRF